MAIREKYRACVAPLGLKKDQRVVFVLCTYTCFVSYDEERLSTCIINGLELKELTGLYEETGS